MSNRIEIAADGKIGVITDAATLSHVDLVVMLALGERMENARRIGGPLGFVTQVEMRSFDRTLMLLAKMVQAADERAKPGASSPVVDDEEATSGN